MDVHAQGNLPFSLVVSGSDRYNVVAPEASGYQSRGIFLGLQKRIEVGMAVGSNLGLA